MNRFFVIWFLVFFISIVFSAATQEKLAINVSLIILSILGVVMSTDLIRDAFFSVSSINWPTVKSKITNSKIEKSFKSIDIDDDHVNDLNTESYRVKFTVEYSVNNKNYQYKFKNPNPKNFETEVEAQEYARRVEAGEELAEINYNPNNPSQSYIEPGIKIYHIFGIPIGVGLVIIPVLTIIGIIKW